MKLQPKMSKTYVEYISEDIKSQVQSDVDKEKEIQDIRNEYGSKYTLVGVNGNAYSVMGYVVTALRREGLDQITAEYKTKATSGNYDDLLAISIDYLEKANDEAAIKAHKQGDKPFEEYDD